MRLLIGAMLWLFVLPASAADLRGHGGPVRAIVASPDGRIATASFDTTIIRWQPQRGVAETVLRGHEGAVNALAAPQHVEARLEDRPGHDLAPVGAGVDVAVSAGLVAEPAHVHLQHLHALGAQAAPHRARHRDVELVDERERAEHKERTRRHDPTA